MSVDGLQLFTPSMVRADMLAIDNTINALAADIKASDVDQRFREEFAKFALEWRDFYKNHESWIKRAFNKTAEVTEQYKRRLYDWRQEFLKRGGQVSVPALRPTPDEAFTLGRVAMIGGLVLGGYVLYKFATRNDEKTISFRASK